MAVLHPLPLTYVLADRMMEGHFVPSKTAWRKFFKEYFRDPTGPVPSPSDYASASGTATPIGGGNAGNVTMTMKL